MLLKRALGVLFGTALLAWLSWQAFFHINFDADPLNLLPQGLPQVESMRTYDEVFASQNDVLIVVTQPDIAVGAEATESLEAYLSERTDLFRTLSGKPPWEKDPSQMGELIAYLWANGPPDALQTVEERLTDAGITASLAASLDTLENSMDVAEMTRASEDPLQLSHFGESAESFDLSAATRFQFVSEEGDLHLLMAEPADSLESDSQVSTWRTAVEKAIGEWEQAHPDLSEGTLVQLTGRKIYMTEVTGALRRDLMVSMLITLGFAMTLFAVLYRRILPLAVLLLALYITFVITLLLGQLLFEDLSAMSVGFAAILMGLAVDYGFVIYQESCCSDEDPRRLRGVFGRSIGWAAATTACVFLLLNRSIMPGAAQLGTMVAIGIGVGALMMIFPYASWLGALRCTGPLPRAQREIDTPLWFGCGRKIAVLTGVGMAAILLVLGTRGFPKLDPDAETLRPNRTQPTIELYRTVMEKLGGDTRTITVMATGQDHAEVRTVMEQGHTILTEDTTTRGVMLPMPLWPDLAQQEANRERLRSLAAREAAALAQAATEGFEDDAMTFAKGVFAAWGRFASEDGSFTLTQASSTWLTDRLLRTDRAASKEPLAIGFVRLQEGRFSLPTETVQALNTLGLRPIGWEFLTPEIITIVRHDIVHVVIPAVILLLVLLAIVFRSLKGVCLSIGLLVFSTLALMAVMRLAGRDWNIVTIAAGPILLGLGLDYSIHVILAMRRTRGDVRSVRLNIGRALLLCGCTTAVGFASLKAARHGGLPLIGEICAVGILITMITAIILIPHWWRFLHRGEDLC